MKKNYLFLKKTFVVLSLFFAVACYEDDPSDPEGTITVRMRNSANGGTRVTPSGTGNYFYIDGANNFYGDYHKFVTIGPMKGLGNVTQIPSSGWASEVAVQPGYGYVARCESYGAYVRIYVVKYVEAVGGGIIGADVKYQSPFVP